MAKKSKTVNDEEISEKDLAELVNGKGIGVYFDKEAGRYILCELDLIPSKDTAVIKSKIKLNASKLAAGLQASVALEKVLGKLK